MNDDNKNPISVKEIAVELISPNPYQPRKHFSDEKLSSLADSIKRYGVMQPIVITEKENGGYELISGERRLRASKIAGLKTIPAVIREHEHSNEEKFELAIIENVQREDLNPVDKAKAFKKLTDEFGLTHSQIASKLGKSREYISNSLRLLVLPDTILDVIARGDITEGHAKPLLMLNDRPFEQQELLKRIINNNLTVRAAVQAVRTLISSGKKGADSEADPDIKIMEKKLAEKLGTRVHIDKKAEGEGGKLTIEYFSKEDLEKIINLVRGKGLSSVPVLESDSAIDNFNNNFNSKESEENTEHFSSEIENLNNSEDIFLDKKIDKFEIKSEGGKAVDDKLVNGFNITSFNHSDNFKNKKTNSLKDEEKEEFETNKSEDIEKNNNFNLENNSIHKINNFNETEEKVDFKKENILNNINNFNINNFSDERVSDLEKEEKIYFKEERVKESLPIKEIVAETDEEENNKKEGIGKSEAQKRIDAILSGTTSVSELYPEKELEESPIKKSFENNTNNTQFESNENIVDVEKEKKDELENSSIYNKFLESKKRIEEQKRRVFESRGGAGTFSDSAADFLNINQNNNKEEVVILEESPLEENKIEKIEEKIDEAETEEIKKDSFFAGDSFIPEVPIKEVSENKKEIREVENNDKFQDKSSLKSSFGTFSI